MSQDTPRPDKYEPSKFESRWQERWEETRLYATPRERSGKKFYCLDFFPYPSGAGLSVGHCRNYVPTDALSRYHRMQGYDVLHPMGWDAFGLPAENAALKSKQHPREITAQFTANYKRQLRLIGTSYDWDYEINSTDPEYYRWTQWFFLLLYERGLAYRATGSQWWCPSCKTILANEQVEQGLCWRCSSVVERKDLEQWYFKITDYADRLLDDLETIDWPERIKTMQANWIGRSEGAEIEFSVGDELLSVFTTRPDTLMGATFLVLAPEHPAVATITTEEQSGAVETYVAEAQRMREIDRLSTEREKTGVFTGAYAEHPLDGSRIPIWIADYVLVGYGTGAIMAVPAHDQRDFDFARRYDLPIRPVIRPEGAEAPETLEEATPGAGVMFDSGEFDGLPSEEGKAAVIRALEQRDRGRARVTYRIRDWLISRQRFWGAPIPIVYCERCGERPVPKEQLPVRLPEEADIRPTGSGRSPLANIDAFVRTTCPDCDGPARRETDTMDGFACSSWYFLRFASPHCDDAPFDPEAVRYWLPVDLYVGGAEHAVMHLLYARFWTKVMFDAGLVPFREPFARLLNQGVLHAADGRRMSKSAGNVITPDSVAEQYGADTLRAFELFMAPFEQDVIWNDRDIRGVHRFLSKVWRLAVQAGSYLSEAPAPGPEPQSLALRKRLHQTIARVQRDIDRLHFNTAIAALMELLPEMTAHHEQHGVTAELAESLGALLRMLAPIAPHVAEELWERAGGGYSIHQQPWPDSDPKLAAVDRKTLVVQVNGKVRERLEVAADITEEAAVAEALQLDNVQRHLEGKTRRKTIYVPGRLLNFVVG